MAVFMSGTSHAIAGEEKENSDAGLRKNKGGKDFDRAHQYILDSVDRVEPDLPVDLKALRRRIDWKIVPLMFCCYTLQFVDKVLLNYAAVMGMNKQLGLIGNNFSNAASAFFVAYLIAEIPNAFILQKVAAPKWLGANVILWGIATGCTAAANNYYSLLACRIFLGVFEAAIAPSLMLMSSQWYTKSEQAPRFGLWYCGLGAGQIIGGLVSYIFQQVKHQAIAGWQIMFIVLGAVTISIGVMAFLVLPNSPIEARFLSEAERLALLKHVSVNRNGMENKNIKLWQLLEGLLDPQLWLMTILTILISISSGVITTYSATLIRNFGFSSPNSALLNMPSGLVSIAYSLLTGYGVRHTSYRWAWIVLCCASGVIGGGLMSFLPSRNRAGLLAGMYLVNAITATLAIIYQWTASNVAGQTKRVASMALIAGSFGVGNIVGPQTFQTKDAPQYIPAKIVVLATQAGGGVFAALLFLYYLWANKRKDNTAIGLEVAESENDGDPSLWENLTDKENRSEGEFLTFCSALMMTHDSDPDLTIGSTESAKSPRRSHVLIIGGGITGLLLAQALKKSDVPFTVFERDPTLSHRGRGWGLTIHWALDRFTSLLPQHLIDRLSEVYVNPEASMSDENGKFMFFDVRSGEMKWTVPPGKRMRVSRERLRALLAEGVDIQWTKSIASFSTDANSITAHFSDLTAVNGTILVGADGSGSNVRSLLARNPRVSLNHRLPVRLLGVSVVYPSSIALKMRVLDPFFIQGGDPKSNVYFWFSFLDTPTNNTRKEDSKSYECQILLSWPYKVGFQGRETPLEVPPSNEERTNLMKSLAPSWANPFKEIVDCIPPSAEVKSISLEDWPPEKGMWDNLGGRVTLVGDAAHTMTTFRGDGANQGIMDISVLLSNIIPLLTTTSPTSLAQMKAAVDAYEDELVTRAAPAVLTSRRACLEAHDYQCITDKSPLVSMRAMVLDSDS